MKRKAGLISLFLWLSFSLTGWATAQIPEAYFDLVEQVIADPAKYNAANYGFSSYQGVGYDDILYCGGKESEVVPANYFALADINGDGITELLFNFSEQLSLSGSGSSIYQANSTGVSKIGGFFRFFYQENGHTYPHAKFYNNGYLFSDASSRQAYGDAIWPYYIYKYNGSQYEYLREVYCLDSGCPDYNSRQDLDGDGVIYYFKGAGESKALTWVEYQEAIADLVGNASEIKPTWQHILKSNVDKLRTELQPEIRVYLNGQLLSFDQKPLLQGGRVLVPVRSVFEALGAEVVWQGATQTVTAAKGKQTIKMTIGSSTAFINGQAHNLDAVPINANGRVLVPLRFVAESLNCEVAWDGKTKTVSITN